MPTHQVAHLKYGKLAIGHYRDDPAELARVLQLWEGAKIEVETAPSLIKARWQKLCWNVPFNGIGTLLGASCHFDFDNFRHTTVCTLSRRGPLPYPQPIQAGSRQT